MPCIGVQGSLLNSEAHQFVHHVGQPRKGLRRHLLSVGHQRALLWYRIFPSVVLKRFFRMRHSDKHAWWDLLVVDLKPNQ